MIRAGIRGEAYDSLRKALSTRQEFKTSGALRGERYDDHKVSPWDSGRLAGDDHEAFRADMQHMTYVVYSYATPIAWVTDDGRVHYVAQKFSVTTSKHQGLMYLL
jgi:hypothetical protein